MAAASCSPESFPSFGNDFSVKDKYAETAIYVSDGGRETCSALTGHRHGLSIRLSTRAWPRGHGYARRGLQTEARNSVGTPVGCITASADSVDAAYSVARFFPVPVRLSDAEDAVRLNSVLSTMTR